MAYGTVLDWGAEVISSSIFVPTLPGDKTVSQWFELAFNEPASQINESVQPHGRQGHAVSFSKSHTKILVLQPGRIEIQAQGAESGNVNTSGPATLSDILGALTDTVAAAKRVLPDLSQIGRLAINVRLVNHQRTLVDANKKILSVLPYKIILEAESDFIFQVNSTGKPGGFPMNRIVKWSVENIQLVAATQFGNGISPTQQFLNQFYSAFVHLDFNTVPTHLTLDTAQVPEMLDVMAAEVVRVRKNSLRFK